MEPAFVTHEVIKYLSLDRSGKSTTITLLKGYSKAEEETSRLQKSKAEELGPPEEHCAMGRQIR